MEDLVCLTCRFQIASPGYHVFDLMPDVPANRPAAHVIELKREGSKADSFSNLLLRTIKRVLVGAKGGFLDVGCGAGYYSQEMFRAEDVLCTGLDIRNAFDTANAPENYYFVRGDLFSKALRAESFDGLVSLDVIEHVEDDYAFLGRCFEVIRGGGVFVIGTPNLNRMASQLRRLFKGKMDFPFDYGTDPVLGETIHRREYGYHELLRSFAQFEELIDFHVVPLLFGVRLPNRFGNRTIGIEYPRGVLGRYCHYWLVYGRKK